MFILCWRGWFCEARVHCSRLNDCFRTAWQFFSSNDYGDDGKAPLDQLKEYKNGQKTAPVPTYFICGKDFGPALDEASTYQEVITLLP